MKLSDIDFC